MDDDADILRKADALLSRHRHASTLDFPVLTEVVAPGSGNQVGIELREKVHSLDHGGAEKPRKELEDIESRILEKILTSTLPRVMSNLEASIKSRLLVGVEQATASMLEEITHLLNAEAIRLVHDAVTKAVDEELSEMRARGPAR